MAPGLIENLLSGSSHPTVAVSKFPPEAHTEAYARSLDAECPLRHLRDQYIIPTKSSLKATTLPESSTPLDSDANLEHEQAIYFCGNSLGLQPKRTASYIAAQLTTWASVGVYGHFSQLSGSPLRAWQDLAAQAAEQSAPIVGAANASEVAIMNSLTANLHLAMAAFYKPVGRRRKILLERKAFPSDHYAVESQVRWHGYEPADAMVLLEPDRDHIISTEKILRVIDELAEEIALVLLPGIQYYTGQLFDIKEITRHAKAKGITIGWDLAHAAGNVPLKLHDWGVDFAAWCTYKYMNAGPGSIAGLFVHERHSKVEFDNHGHPVYVPRLMGWYGGDKASRFKMDNNFMPIPGAGGFQLSNPSAIDLASLNASLAVFSETSIDALREKSLKMTAYLQHLLLNGTSEDDSERPFRIITPLDPNHRGAQLSVLLEPNYLKEVNTILKEAGIVADQREPDVVRVAPVPMYNTYGDVWKFVREFKKALGIWEED